MIERSLVLHFVIDTIARTAVVFSLFLLFAGHNDPGGGFVAGLVTGTALTLRAIALGRRGVVDVLPTSPDALMGIGLAVSLTTGVLGWVWGPTFLKGAKISLTLPVLGELKATTALPFDIGVFLVVVGVTASLILALGEQEVAS